ncbi:hypothetical protein [Aureimonas psammosilenae]|uniref:hypothetical protein n=1 Tax=Aureimonas psammosilenae TaxID=2495496 RepID=UPI0012604C5F|nr:hypothetical protein [Aureimonas psammosilenae]
MLRTGEAENGHERPHAAFRNGVYRASGDQPAADRSRRSIGFRAPFRIPQDMWEGDEFTPNWA